MKTTFNPFSLTGKNIIVTGASSGIGRQCAIDCSRMGARIILVARNRERLEETRSLMSVDNHIIACIDLENIAEIGKKIRPILENIGSCHGLIHAAGIENTASLKYTNISDCELLYKVNTLSAIEIIKTLSSKKYSQEGTSMVLISSISGIIGRAGTIGYAASKGALITACRTMAIELSRRKIRINCVSPGTILTPMMEKYLSVLTEEQRKKRLEGFLLGIGNPDDISNACIYLLSDASKWVTGQNLIVDGGYTIT